MNTFLLSTVLALATLCLSVSALQFPPLQHYLHVHFLLFAGCSRRQPGRQLLASLVQLSWPQRCITVWPSLFFSPSKMLLCCATISSGLRLPMVSRLPSPRPPTCCRCAGTANWQKLLPSEWRPPKALCTGETRLLKWHFLPRLADTAQWGHDSSENRAVSGFRYVGQNLAMSASSRSGFAFDVVDSVNRWYAEVSLAATVICLCCPLTC